MKWMDKVGVMLKSEEGVTQKSASLMNIDAAILKQLSRWGREAHQERKHSSVPSSLCSDIFF